MCPRPTSLISTTIPSKTPVETALLPNGVGVNVLTGTNKSPLCPFGHLYPPNPSSTCGLATKIEPVFCWQCPPFPPSRDGYGSLKGRACQEEKRGKVEEGRERSRAPGSVCFPVSLTSRCHGNRNDKRERSYVHHRQPKPCSPHRQSRLGLTRVTTLNLAFNLSNLSKGVSLTGHMLSSDYIRQILSHDMGSGCSSFRTGYSGLESTRADNAR